MDLNLALGKDMLDKASLLLRIKSEHHVNDALRLLWPVFVLHVLTSSWSSQDFSLLYTSHDREVLGMPPPTFKQPS